MTTTKVHSGTSIYRVKHDTEADRYSMDLGKITLHKSEGRVSVQGYGSFEVITDDDMSDEWAGLSLYPMNEGARRLTGHSSNTSEKDRKDEIRRKLGALTTHAYGSCHFHGFTESRNRHS